MDVRSKNIKTVSIPFYEPPPRKTSAEIINEARLAIRGNLHTIILHITIKNKHSFHFTSTEHQINIQNVRRASDDTKMYEMLKRFKFQTSENLKTNIY